MTIPRPTLLSGLLTLAVLASLPVQTPTVLTSALVVLWLTYHAYQLGQRFWPGSSHYHQIVSGLFGLTSGIAILGTAVYVLWKFTPLVSGIIVLLTPFAIATLPRRPQTINQNLVINWLRALSFFQKLQWASIRTALLRWLRQPLGWLPLLLDGVLVWLAWASQTSASVNTIWATLPREWLWLWAVTTALVLLATLRLPSRAWRRTLTHLHLLTTVSVVAIVYQVGYGFDPFIHRATEELIAHSGVVTPKTPYYLGQYVLITFFSHLTGISIHSLDIWLLPLGAALFLPWAAALAWHYLSRPHRVTTSTDESSTPNAVAAFSLLLAPFAGWLVTTPQGLGNLWLVVTVTLLAAGSVSSWPLMTLGALTTLTFHPVSGLPLIAVALLAASQHSSVARKHWLSALVCLGGITILPAAFWLQSHVSTAAGGFAFGPIQWQSLSTLLATLLPHFPRSLSLSQDWFHLLGGNAGWLLAILSVIGLAAWWRARHANTLWPLVGGAIITAGGALLTQAFIQFNSVAASEQLDYPRRILAVALLFLLPVALAGVATLTTRVATRPRLAGLWLGLFTLTLTASVYAAYPHADAQNPGRFYSTGSADRLAVRLINEHFGADTPYIVLANQAVSAAALEAFGFSHYYATSAGPLFYYPIPTTSPLASDYLAFMNQTESFQTITTRAMDRVGVQAAAVVVNRYWTNASGVIAAATPTADDITTTADGSLTILYYTY